MSCYYEDCFDVIKATHVASTSYTEESLNLTLSNGSKIEYRAIGECCSSSFIESIDDLSVLQDCTIFDVQIVEGESKDVDDYSVHKWHFVKFKTSKGWATLSFRNESNGYYDGQLELINCN